MTVSTIVKYLKTAVNDLVSLSAILTNKKMQHIFET